MKNDSLKFKILHFTLSFCILVFTFLIVPLSASAITRAPNNLGLVGYWPMNEGTGTKVFDKSGMGNTGALTGGTWINGKFGSALNFVGNQDIQVGQKNYFGQAPFTASFWVKTNTLPGNKGDGTHDNIIIGQYDCCGPIWSSWSLYEGASSWGSVANKFILSVVDTGGTGHFVWSDSVPVVGQWYDVVVTVDASYNMKMYVNGVLQTKTDNSGSMYMVTNGTFFMSDQFNNGALPGALDEVRFYTRALSASEVKKLYQSGAAKVGASSASLDNGGSLSNGLVGLWTFDGKDTVWTSATAGTVKDASGQGNTGTLTGMNRTTSPTIGKLGQALKFRGVTNNYVSISHKSYFTQAPFTFSAWVKFNVLPSVMGTQPVIVMKRHSADPWDSWSLSGNVNGGANTFIFEVINSSKVAFYRESDSAITVGRWYHVVVTLDSSYNMKMYVDGVNQVLNGPPKNSGSIYSSDGSLYIGEIIGTSINGSIDDARFYNRALSAGEVMDLYKLGGDKINTSSASLDNVGSLSNGLVGLWTFDGKDTVWTSATAGTVKDLSGQGNTGTLYNMNRKTSPTIGKIGQGLKFNGINQDVEIAHKNYFAQAPFTASVWVKTDTLPTNKGDGTADSHIFYKSNSGGPIWQSWFFLECGSNWVGNLNKLVFIVYDAGGGGHTIFSDSAIKAGQWYHLMVSIDASYNMKMYVNGVQQASTANSGSMFLSNSVLNISGQYSNLSMAGSFDDVRIYNRTLSVTEIKQLYNLGR